VHTQQTRYGFAVDSSVTPNNSDGRIRINQPPMPFREGDEGAIFTPLRIPDYFSRSFADPCADLLNAVFIPS
jgi:hypothetical protein